MGRKAPPFAPAGRKRKGRRAGAEIRRRGLHYIAFRAVCSGWRTCAPAPRDPTLRIPSLRPVGWVALCQITFFHTQTARCLRVRLPELRRHRIIGFTDGLVILLHKRTTAVRVLNPFTGAAVDFPSLIPVYQQLIRNRNCVLGMNAASPKFVHPDVEVWRRYIIAIFKVKISMSGHHELIPVHDGKEMVCPSVRPFTLADHLLTYCNHHEWSNGLMFHEYYFIPESFQGLWKKIRTQDSQLVIVLSYLKEGQDSTFLCLDEYWKDVGKQHQVDQQQACDRAYSGLFPIIKVPDGILLHPTAMNIGGSKKVKF
ncbi:hypothetical protein TRIUR3_20814 [Triticum urartu]|uniref:Uncharacterized protein n=1 Tax=Triticum urartu TaxID=4572 RepID=M7Z339_TRIUA|nr:hypothetical protein TRIUR3_20814 [Triticum urartu]